jgi:arginine-tRNA-protein transferase
VAERNSDLIARVIESRPTSEQYALFRDYLAARHAEGGMADMSILDYAMMIEDSHVETRLIEYRRRGPDSGFTGRGVGPLVALCVTDILADGLSMVYSFYDPEQADRSLGTFMILDHLERARAQALPHLYLGYWVDGSRKMGYKARFLPQERLGMNGWERAE